MRPSKPDLDALCAVARELGPRLRERAARAEALRTLPDETLSELRDSGLYRIFQPNRYGGHELDFIALLRITGELARHCASTAWVYANLAEHHRLNGMRDPRAQDELWGPDPDATVSAAFPGDRASFKRVEGGVLLEGTWGFASGIDAASWNDFTIFLPREGGGAPEHFFALAPKREFEVIDDWHATGLRGTGSKSLRVSQQPVCARASPGKHRALPRQPH
jgi:3-hydroxy-9,10-secoandrosta-1,3,5(10)-triene-9,17-dione monooxygenase